VDFEGRHLRLDIGLPVALIFVWAFEPTSKGLKRTEDVVFSRSLERPLFAGAKFPRTTAILMLVLSAPIC
jgi:hypothetical protein